MRPFIVSAANVNDHASAGCKGCVRGRARGRRAFGRPRRRRWRARPETLRFTAGATSARAGAHARRCEEQRGRACYAGSNTTGWAYALCVYAQAKLMSGSRAVVGGGARQRAHARTRATALGFRWVHSITFSRSGRIQVHAGQARSSSNHTFICVDHRNSVHTYARTA